jgi:hypothetical protein
MGMESHQRGPRANLPDRSELRIHPVPHPNTRVRQVGFPLDAAYVEQVWVSQIGPSATLMLRRIAALWDQQGRPATVDAIEFGRSLGLGPPVTGRTLGRLLQFGMARVTSDGLGVHTRVAPLSARQLSRVTPLTRQAHDRLLAAHLEWLARTPTGAAADPADRIAARLDHLERARLDRARTDARGLTR